MESHAEAAPLLVAGGLSYAYGVNPVLTSVALQVAAGEVVALVGRNGAGKSTLLRCLSGWTRPRSGDVRVLGASLARAERRLRRHVVLVPDSPSFWDDLTGWEHMRFVAGVHRMAGWQESAESLFRSLGLAQQRDGFPAAYSRGMRYKLALAMALLVRPSLLLLDEPFGPLDGESAAGLWAMLQGRARDGGGVLLSCHHLPPGAVPDRYLVLEGGQLKAAGTPAELCSDLGIDEATPERLLGTVGDSRPGTGADG